jgi:poly-gamma-glutamate synthesis protein (capsule biosynthesis protein)
MHDSESDASKITVIEKNGIRIAMLNYTYGVNPAGSAALFASPYLVDVLDERKITADCAKADAIADIIVVSVHWGEEYTHTPSDSQQKWAKLFLECGVDLVLGTHPHVMQPIEWMEDDEGNKMLVYWSLGNFVNCTAESGKGKGDRMIGAIAAVEFAKIDGTSYIKTASAIPVITHVEDGFEGITVYRFDDYSKEMFEKSDITRIDPTVTYEYCKDSFDSLLGTFLTRGDPFG